MIQRPRELERAFEIARSGRVATVDGIRRQLRSESYTGDQLLGRALMTQLREAIREGMNSRRA
jgi:hypothetical protein